MDERDVDEKEESKVTTSKVLGKRQPRHNIQPEMILDAVDAATTAVFKIYMQEAKSRKMVRPDTRNTLIRSLCYRYGVPEERLVDMFNLKARTIK